MNDPPLDGADAPVDELIAINSAIEKDWERWHAQYSGAEQLRSPPEGGAFPSKTLKQIATEYENHQRDSYAFVHEAAPNLADFFAALIHDARDSLNEPLAHGARVRFVELQSLTERFLSEVARQAEKKEVDARGVQSLFAAIKKPRTFDWWVLGIGLAALLVSVVFGIVGVWLTVR